MSTHNIPFSIYIKKKISLNYPKSAAMGFFLGTKERVRKNRDKRAISVRATEVLLFCGCRSVFLNSHFSSVTPFVIHCA